MSANSRIQWLHKMIAENSYPNAQRLAERFHVSHRQAQRDVDFLRNKLGAPLAFNRLKVGFYYTEPFTLPAGYSTDGEENFTELATAFYKANIAQPKDKVAQLQIPYTALLEIPGKLTVVELGNLVVGKETRNRYHCEFQNIDLFLSILLCVEDDIRILEPKWLRDRLLSLAKRAIRNNESIESDKENSPLSTETDTPTDK